MSPYKMEKKQLQDELVEVRRELRLKDEEIALLNASLRLANKKYLDLLESKPIDKLVVDGRETLGVIGTLPV